jgi:hypothetical protein
MCVPLQMSYISGFAPHFGSSLSPPHSLPNFTLQFLQAHILKQVLPCLTAQPLDLVFSRGLSHLSGSVYAPDNP